MFSSNTSQVSNDAVFVEDVFSTWLYTGNGSTQTITNGIDLAGKGGMVWLKGRSAASNHSLYDTARGINRRLRSNDTSAENTSTQQLTSFNSNGFDLGVNEFNNSSGLNAVSWTFRKQPKFFDVVTYTGNGANRTIPHNLGSVPGCIITKRTDVGGDDWATYHRSLGASAYISLNTTTASQATSTGWNDTAPTSTTFSLGPSSLANASGGTYVAYLFAHNAGGFGLTGTDNVISCGSYTGNGTNVGPTITLGYEPQWVMVKRSSAAGTNWYIIDNMRGFSVNDSNGDALLQPNTSAAETSNNIGGTYMVPTSTGFQIRSTDGEVNSNGQTYIYIAIRRGPMRTPTSGTSVFSPVTRAGTSADATVSAGFPPDSLLVKNRGGSASSVDWSFNFFDKLRSPGYRLSTAFTNAEDTSVNFITSFDQNGVTLPATGYTATNGSGYNYINYFLRRAPGFFDEVCYTGTGADNTQITHNLGVAPELIITKKRSSTGDWWTLCTADADRRVGRVNLTNAFTNSGIASIFGNGTSYVAPTASVFTLGSGSTSTNTSGATYVAYLFASCPGVSKVGSYTGTGATQTIDCGFTGGARFVLIKRTDSTGDWYVWDSARGIVAGNDPYLLLNSTAAEVTSTDYVDTYSAGFEISSTAPAAINASGGSFIFLAIA